MYTLTIFKNRFDNKTHKTVSLDSWVSFVRFFENMSKVELDSKTDAHLISPAIYKPDTTRKNVNVECWSPWCAIDVDDYDGTLEDILERFKNKLDYIVYNTASCTENTLKLRLVLRLSRQVEHDEINHLWYALNKELGEIGDPQTKDMARMYYVPATYKNARNFFHSHICGGEVDVDELITKHEYREKSGNSFIDRLPKELQKAVIDHRKQSMQNRSITWTSYRDCPFFPRTLAEEYKHISSTGWYQKMYQIMVSTACRALYREYPITSKEIATLCREFDKDNGNWYETRPIEIEADRAIEYAYRNN